MKFHNTVVQLLRSSQKNRPEILPIVSFLTTRAFSPYLDDWKKLKQLLQYLKATIDVMHTLSIIMSAW